MKKITVLVLIFSIMLSFTACNKRTDEEPDYYFTENVEDFYNINFSIKNRHDIFSYDIPTNAEIISFYFRDATDYLLYDVMVELKFDSEEEVDSYIEDIKIISSEKFKTDNGVSSIEEQNPYNDDFIDLFVADVSLNGYENTLRIPPWGKPLVKALSHNLRSNLICFSYSRSQAKVLIFITLSITTHGDNYDSLKIPRYFVYFKVPLTQNFQRVFVFE